MYRWLWDMKMCIILVNYFKKYYGIAPVYYKRQAQKESGKEIK